MKNVGRIPCGNVEVALCAKPCLSRKNFPCTIWLRHSSFSTIISAFQFVFNHYLTLYALHPPVKGGGICQKFADMLAPLDWQIGALWDCGGLVDLAQWLAAHGVEDAAGEQ